MIILAKAIKNHEFLYNARSAHKVPKSSASIICQALNDANYNLQDNEIWHMYEVSYYNNAFCYAETQEFKRRNGRLIEVRH